MQGSAKSHRVSASPDSKNKPEPFKTPPVVVVETGVYTGERNGPQKQGKGVMEYENGGVYDGLWGNDKRHGSGCYMFSTGDLYTGEWVDGYAQGNGTFTFAGEGEEEEPAVNLWVKGACLRLVPSISFQLGEHEDEKGVKKSSLNNLLDDWKQVLGTSPPPESGVYTAQNLRERLDEDAESKQWLTWLYFCTKWERGIYGSTSVFLAFPDISRGTFLSLTQVITMSGLMEKLVMRYISSNESSQDTELQKLLSLCLDIGEDEAGIQHIIKDLKSAREFARPLLSPLPPYFTHPLAHTLSAFKRSPSPTLHFLTLQLASLEQRLLIPPAQSSLEEKKHPSPSPLQMLHLLKKMQIERVNMEAHERLETAPKVVERVLSEISAAREFVERKVGALEREDAIFLENMSIFKSQEPLKNFEENDQMAYTLLDQYVGDKMVVFQAIAEGHKKDIQMMAHISKACEDLYIFLYQKILSITVHDFKNCSLILEKILSTTSKDNINEELLEVCEEICRFESHQLSELHRIAGFSAPFDADILDLISKHRKDFFKLQEKAKSLSSLPLPSNPLSTSPPPVPSGPPTSPSYLSLALNFTKGLFKNTSSASMSENQTFPTRKEDSNAFQAINIKNLESNLGLLKALLRDHSHEEILAHASSTVLRYLSQNLIISLPKDLIAQIILCLQDSTNPELRAACLCVLNSRFGQDDEHRKEFSDNFLNVLVSVLDTAIKETVPQIGPPLGELLVSLTSGLNEVKAAVATRLGVKKLIDLMDTGGRISSESTTHSIAQVLANLSYKEEYLVEISSKGGLVRVLEVAKLGRIKVHAHIPENELQIGETLGAGTFAEVKKANWQDKIVAVKIFKEATFTFRLEDFWKEVAIMSLIKHDNILRLLGATITPRKDNSTFMLITEYMQKGTLRDIIKSVGPFPAPLVIRHALEVARGLAYMHTLDVVHRDIKASNILVDEHDIAKVADLGLSRVNNSLNMTQLTGTPKWEAPECLTSSLYSKSADVYSYGVLLSEMVTGEEPFPEVNEMSELKKMVCDQKLRPKLPHKAPNCPEYLTNLIKACWNHDPKKRPTFDQIVEKLSSPLPQ